MSEKYWSKRRLIHELRHGRLSSKLDANTIRVVAAVNACAGIPTAALEAGVVGEVVEALRLADGFLANRGYSKHDPLVRGAIRAILAKLDQEGSE